MGWICSADYRNRKCSLLSVLCGRGRWLALIRDTLESCGLNLLSER
jgi:hypothetical protein